VTVFLSVDAAACTAYNTTSNLQQGTYDVEIWKVAKQGTPLITMAEINIEDPSARSHITVWYEWSYNVSQLTFDGGRKSNDINNGYVRMVNLATMPSEEPLRTVFLYHRNTNCYRCNASFVTMTNSTRNTDYVQLQSDFPEEVG
jgi:hypothetical protein